MCECVPIVTTASAAAAAEALEAIPNHFLFLLIIFLIHSFPSLQNIRLIYCHIAFIQHSAEKALAMKSASNPTEAPVHVWSNA